MGVDEEFQKIIAGLFNSGDGRKQDGQKPLDHLDQSASRSAVDDLFDSGYLSGEALLAAREYLHQPLAWWRWTSRMLLLAGSALILAGIVFFFAFNWNRLGNYPRFAMIEAGLAACIIAALLSDMEELPGKLFITAASVLTGVLLLVFGQTYNTGVDSASLYILWASFIFAWVAIAEFDILWVGWLALVNVAAGLYWNQTYTPDEPGFARLMIALALIDGFMLVLREYGSISIGLEWLQAIWVRRLLVIAIFTSLTIPTMMLILEERLAGTLYYFIAAALLAGSWVGGYRYLRHTVRDLGSLTVVALSACMVAISFAGRFFEAIDADYAVVFLIFGFLVAAVFGAAVAWLRRINMSMAGEDNA
ncbi:MAG: DUF2157 domain-containing protein [Thermoleophilia bacterium]|nr:DUF2157 domain-containing protein [Thermoleophilia bacterium]